MIRSLLTGASLLALAGFGSPAFAANEDTAAEDQAIQSSREIVVQGGIGYRNRSDEAEPVLIYDEEYFQRFEPLTAGDALKRVPSVTFLSDVIESDGARLRGLDPGYTQILINGERVPGGQADRSFFLDRIPAELIKQVEIVRSSSARRTGDAVAGSLNIVLRDALTLDGGYFRAGGLHFDDGEVKPAVGFYYGGKLGPGRVLFGANVQGRYNPKRKQSLRFGDSPENNADFFEDDFDNREDQTDTRDGMDYALNGSWVIDGDTTDFELSGNYVLTDRTENERSLEFNRPTGLFAPLPEEGSDEAGLLTDNSNLNRINQENYSISAKLKHRWAAGETRLRGTFSRFDDHQDETEYELGFDEEDPVFEGAYTRTRIRDDELSFTLDHTIPLTDTVNVVFGGFFQNKDRRTDIAIAEQEADLPGAARGYDPYIQTVGRFIGDFEEFESAPGGLNKVTEDRRDAYVLVEGKSARLSWEAGLRWENTKTRIADLEDLSVTNLDYDILLPSASLKWDIGMGRVTASVARTVRRPRFDYLAPALLEEEVADNDQLGNPLLKPETAWGGDLGYEHHIGRSGVVGVNVFYRRITDLVELVNTGEEGSEGAGTFVYQPQNIGKGEVYGVEFDLSASLSFLGLPETGVFGNFAYIDSKITDDLGERRFNGQPKYVYNFGFIQNLRSAAAAFGATYRKQGTAFGRVIGEEVTTTYGADLEIFVEKRFGDSVTLRAVGSNLLDAKKREVFNKFDSLDDQIDREIDEYELESERAGPVFQLVARAAF